MSLGDEHVPPSIGPKGIHASSIRQKKVAPIDVLPDRTYHKGRGGLGVSPLPPIHICAVGDHHLDRRVVARPANHTKEPCIFVDSSGAQSMVGIEICYSVYKSFKLSNKSKWIPRLLNEGEKPFVLIHLESRILRCADERFETVRLIVKADRYLQSCPV
jgi:hypothetical protein